MKLIKKILIVLIVFSVACVAGFFYLTSASSSGPSMEPTIRDGARQFLSPFYNPQVGDVIAFDCLSAKCLSEGMGDSPGLTKRLISINEQGCYWVEGDNKKHSWDSRAYGWLCPGDDIDFVTTVLFSF